MGRTKIDTSGQEQAAREQAAAIADQTAVTRMAANETLKQSAQQIALASQRQQVSDQIEANNAASKPEAVDVNLNPTGSTDTIVRKRAKYQLPTDPSASIRI